MNNSIINSLLKLFLTTDTNDFSDEQARRVIYKATQPQVKEYKKGRENINSHFNKEKSLDRLIILRLFAYDLWNIILSKNPEGRVAYVVDEAILRVQIATDENITLIGHGYGIGATNNLRQMLESLAIVKYLKDKGEAEAERFQDHAEYQSSEILQEKKIIEKYKNEPSFHTPYGWISDKENNSYSKLIKLIGNEDYNGMYILCCNLIHASSFSMEIVKTLNHERQGCEYFPLGLEDTIRFNEKIIVDFLVFIIDSYMDERKPAIPGMDDFPEKRFYKILLKTIVDNMEGCPGDELLKLV